jgi:hypothetical protein
MMLTIQGQDEKARYAMKQIFGVLNIVELITCILRCVACIRALTIEHFFL